MAGHKKPVARPQIPDKPLRNGNGLPERPGGIRRRRVQEDDFEVLYIELDSRSNLLESRPRLLNLSWIKESRTRFSRDLGVYVQAFADDVFLMFFGQSTVLEAEANQVLAHVKDWGDRNKHSHSGQGHVGIKSGIVRTIYVVVVEPIVVFASCAWVPAASKLGVRKMFDALQHSVTLKACRANRTVSLHSALILAKLLPLDIWVRETAWLYEVKCRKHLRSICADRELESPVDFCELPHPAHVPELGYESVEDLDTTTIDRLAIVGPHTYTDGS
ncbi:hypothetical protein EVAR_22630_1 [Eumeta japonica]|uniref:Reverse transcriptase domain-containing protein n=1 Tax=Eumeta variegata TaxID=151549 RepID=A0A4C1VJQ9_EUMVA|nr:hypothetical protein EVAR_22630_1 [Eumeta japonica]